MGHWSFVALAYGIVWSVIVVYFFSLKRRYRKAQVELSALTSAQTINEHEQT
ncbi:MAG TPA: CcmD family protein [Candidatus Binatia bacterium]|nr:CcmD family protein [Candidatus Binatia bacterium]